MSNQKPKPIRIGDTFERKYIFSDNAVPPNPLDLSDIDISFCLKTKGQLRIFTIIDGVTIIPLTGIVEIEIADEVTSTFEVDYHGASYLLFVYPNGIEKSRVQLKERFVAQEVMQ